jgi:hypothetical protein
MGATGQPRCEYRQQIGDKVPQPRWQDSLIVPRPKLCACLVEETLRYNWVRGAFNSLWRNFTIQLGTRGFHLSLKKLRNTTWYAGLSTLFEETSRYNLLRGAFNFRWRNFTTQLGMRGFQLLLNKIGDQKHAAHASAVNPVKTNTFRTAQKFKCPISQMSSFQSI